MGASFFFCQKNCEEMIFMKKPLIGVVPLVDLEKESYWMLPGYMKGIEQAGGLPLMMPLTDDRTEIEQLADSLDGFLFTGGQDVSPSLYDGVLSDKCGERIKLRDDMEAELFKLVYSMDKPALGICRGIQLINAVMGGTLYQDLPTEHPSKVVHHQMPPYSGPAHSVKINKESSLYQLLEKEELMVNSVHHQAIKSLATGLGSMAVSEDGLVEALYAKGKKFIWAVQWHPEYSYVSDEDSRKIFRKFIGSCQ